MFLDDVILGALVAALPLYNLFANRWPPFNKALFIPMNLALAVVLLSVAVGPLDLTSESVFGRSTATGVAVGFLLGLAATAPLFALSLFERGARLVRDERVANLSGWTLAYQVLLRIPLGTAFAEEVAFRGVLFAAWRDSGALGAAIYSSLVFGLWHVGPTINAVRANTPEASAVTTARAVAGAVVFTTAAGLLFSWLRVRFGLGGTIALHATGNALATVASVIAARRLQTSKSAR